jgi:hypothetical protein
MMPLVFHAVAIMVPTARAMLIESNSKLVATLTLTKDFPPLFTIDDMNDQPIRTGEER